MKNLLLIIFLAFITISCFDEEERFAKNLEAPGQILFIIPDANRPLPPANQTAVTQPSYSLVSGRFSRTGNLTMTVQVSANVKNMVVNLVTNTGVRQVRATFNNVSGTVELSVPMNTLGLNNAAHTTGTLVLEFVGMDESNAEVVRRMFSVTAIA